MKKLILALLSLAVVGCQSREAMITPTTEVAPEGAKIEGLRYYPGISIGIRMENFEQYLVKIAEAGFKYIEISIAHKSGLAQMTKRLLTFLQQSVIKQQQMVLRCGQFTYHLRTRCGQISVARRLFAARA